MTAVLTNPIWVVKTRMLSSGRDTPGAYRGMAHGFATIVRIEGFLGLYRGLLPSLFGVSHGAVQFAVYEVLKKKGVRTGWKKKERDVDVDAQPASHDRSGSGTGQSSAQSSRETRPSTLSTILFSTTAKSIATGITYPYQVVRARLQTYDAGKTYQSLGDVLVQMARGEGIVGFYKG